jgi:hypothetical protein
MITVWARIPVFLLCFMFAAAAAHARTSASSLSLVYSSNSFGVLAPCPS